MNAPEIHDLQDAVPYFTEFVLPEIEKAVEVACRTLALDENNDTWVFGTTLWRNLWNRVKRMAQADDNPFRVFERENAYDFCLGTLRVRHHRVNATTLLPGSGVAAKSYADYNQFRFDGDGFGAPGFDHAVLAIVAHPVTGLREVFIGILGRTASGYHWIQQAPILAPQVDAQDSPPLAAEMVPEEQAVDFDLELRVRGDEQAEG